MSDDPYIPPEHTYVSRRGKGRKSSAVTRRTVKKSPIQKKVGVTGVQDTSPSVLIPLYGISDVSMLNERVQVFSLFPDGQEQARIVRAIFVQRSTLHSDGFAWHRKTTRCDKHMVLNVFFNCAFPGCDGRKQMTINQETGKTTVARCRGHCHGPVFVSCNPQQFTCYIQKTSSVSFSAPPLSPTFAHKEAYPLTPDSPSAIFSHSGINDFQSASYGACTALVTPFTHINCTSPVLCLPPYSECQFSLSVQPPTPISSMLHAPPSPSVGVASYSAPVQREYPIVAPPTSCQVVVVSTRLRIGIQIVEVALAYSQIIASTQESGSFELSTPSVFTAFTGTEARSRLEAYLRRYQSVSRVFVVEGSIWEEIAYDIGYQVSSLLSLPSDWARRLASSIYEERRITMDDCATAQVSSAFIPVGEENADDHDTEVRLSAFSQAFEELFARIQEGRPREWCIDREIQANTALTRTMKITAKSRLFTLPFDALFGYRGLTDIVFNQFNLDNALSISSHLPEMVNIAWNWIMVTLQSIPRGAIKQNNVTTIVSTFNENLGYWFDQYKYAKEPIMDRQPLPLPPIDFIDNTRTPLFQFPF